MRLRNQTESLRDLLRAQVGDSLTEEAESPGWILELATAFRNDLGLLAVNGVKGLSENRALQSQRIPLSCADDLVLLLAGNAAAERQHIGIATPPGTVMMPMLIACKLLLGDLLASNQVLDGITYHGFKERGGILLISPDSELRVRYFDMRVGMERIVEAYPACRMRPDGSIAPVLATQAPAQQYSVCFFLAPHRQLPDMPAFKPSIVLLDLTHDRWLDRLSDLIAWCMALRNKAGEPANLIALLPFGDRFVREALDAHGIGIFPLDCAGVDEVVRSFARIPELTEDETDLARSWSLGSYALDKPLERAYQIVYIPEEAATDVLQTAANVYTALDAIGDRHPHRDLRLARWLVGTMMQLPIPVQWYEQHAYLMGNRQTLKKLILSIGQSGSGTLHAELAPLLQSLRGQLELLYNRLNSANPKSEAFLAYYREQVRMAVAEKKTTTILVRNDVVARAVWPWLQSEGEQLDNERVRVLTYRGVDSREIYDHMVAFAWWPTRYRWQIGGRLARHIDFLLYRGEETILERQMRTFYSPRYQQACARRRLSTLHALGDIAAVPADPFPLLAESGPRIGSLFSHRHVPMPPDAEILPEEMEEEVEPEIRSLFESVTLNPASFTAPHTLGVTSLASAAPAYVPRVGEEAVDEHDTVGIDESETAAGATTEECVLLIVRRRSENRIAEIGYLYLDQDGASDCYVPGPSDAEVAVTRVANDEIEPGYFVIRTDQDDRQSLFERVVHLADAQPTMKYLKIWRQYWLDAIDSLVQKHASGRAKRGTYQSLKKQLDDAGVHVTTVTVRDWVLGERIGPASVAAVEAVGLLSGHQQLQQYPRQVEEAFKQIRTIHQVLGRRISAAIQSVGAEPVNSKAKTGKKEVFLDPALSLPIDDLLDLLQFWEVERVDRGLWAVPVTRVGTVLPRPLFGIE